MDVPGETLHSIITLKLRSNLLSDSMPESHTACSRHPHFPDGQYEKSKSVLTQSRGGRGKGSSIGLLLQRPGLAFGPWKSGYIGAPRPGDRFCTVVGCFFRAAASAVKPGLQMSFRLIFWPSMMNWSFKETHSSLFVAVSSRSWSVSESSGVIEGEDKSGRKSEVSSSSAMDEKICRWGIGSKLCILFLWKRWCWWSVIDIE